MPRTISGGARPPAEDELDAPKLFLTRAPKAYRCKERLVANLFLNEQFQHPDQELKSHHENGTLEFLRIIGDAEAPKQSPKQFIQGISSHESLMSRSIRMRRRLKLNV